MSKHGSTPAVYTTWAEFTAKAASRGLEAADLTNQQNPNAQHWQVRGGPVAVEYWPRRGTWKAVVNGQEASPVLKGPVDELMAVAAGRVGLHQLRYSRPLKAHNYRVSWAEFAARVRSVGLIPFNCVGPQPAWQIKGGKTVVTYWPGTGDFRSADGGRTHHRKTLSDAIKLAGGPRTGPNAPVQIPRGSTNVRDWNRVLSSMGLRAM